ncbi:MAG: glycosyltransferase family 2 protein [Bacteroidia bacterium]|nr:glycosyltransferase family 2 protein [Bacteroidia bacterium]
MSTLTASIVAYKNEAAILDATIRSFLKGTTDARLFVVDNSPTDALRAVATHDRVEYFFNNKNVGFGAGHNQILRSVIDASTYHLVLNPDVYFDNLVMPELTAYLEQNPDVGQVMPKVLYPDGKLQPLCKLLPTPKTLILRRFLAFLKKKLHSENFQYELHQFGYDRVLNVPFLSGCFMLLRTEALRKVGLFDERFFLYTEDTDLTRRIHKHYRTVFYPGVTIYHHHARGSYKHLWLTLYNMQSAYRYFNKWGWVVDTERELFNRRTLNQYTTIL